MKIFIINLHSSHNAGDAALTLTASQQLHEAFQDSKITLSMNYPTSHPEGDPKVGSFMYWFHTPTGNSQPKWRIGEILRLGFASLVAVTTFRWFKRPIFPFVSGQQKAFLQVYFESDLVASAPGNFLYSSGTFGVSFLVAIYSMAYAIWAGKPLYILPQSIGPLKRNWERWLIRYVFNRARLIMVREEISTEQIRHAGVANPNVILQPDMAFSFQAAPSKDAVNWLLSRGIEKGNDGPLLGITAINWGVQSGLHTLQEKYETALSDAVRYFVGHIGGKAIFFPQVAGSIPFDDDRLPARRIVESLSDLGQKVILVDQPHSPALLKAIFGLMDILIGSRMHSNIFALSNNVPVLAIAYQHKTMGIMHMLGLDEWVMDIHTVKSPTLVERLGALWEHRLAVREHIQQVIQPIQSQSSHTGDILAEDFKETKKT